MDSKKTLGIVLVVIGLIVAVWGLIAAANCLALMGTGGLQCGYENPVTIITFIIGIVILLIGIYVYRK